MATCKSMTPPAPTGTPGAPRPSTVGDPGRVSSKRAGLTGTKPDSTGIHPATRGRRIRLAPQGVAMDPALNLAPLLGWVVRDHEASQPQSLRCANRARSARWRLRRIGE